jgi:hypothetical protein
MVHKYSEDLIGAKINTDKRDLHNKATKRMREATTLLLLLRPLGDAVKFYTFEKI